MLFENDLSLSSYISKTVRTCFYQLRKLKSVRRSLPIDAARTLVNAFVVSRLDYCNSLLAEQPSCQLNRLQAVQNAAARLLIGTSRYDHITPALKSLHWLKVRERIIYKLCLLVYNAKNGQAPTYIQELCVPVTVENRPRLRSTSNNNLIKCTAVTKFGDRAFRVAGPNAWNALPNDIKTATTVNTFKSKLKFHLFTVSYPN